MPSWNWISQVQGQLETGCKCSKAAFKIKLHVFNNYSAWFVSRLIRMPKSHCNLGKLNSSFHLSSWCHGAREGSLFLFQCAGFLWSSPVAVVLNNDAFGRFFRLILLRHLLILFPSLRPPHPPLTCVTVVNMISSMAAAIITEVFMFLLCVWEQLAVKREIEMSFYYN